jgi:hypothetical protein
VAEREQPIDKVAADEARTSGNETAHQ